MSLFHKLFGKNEENVVSTKEPTKAIKSKVKAERIGDIGEYKINIQLDQFPKNYKHLSDLMITNQKSTSGYSQIDHLLLTPFGLFVIETKNYTGEILGSKEDKEWTVNKKFKMKNPFHQNFGHIEAIKTLIGIKKKESFISVISFNRRATFRIDPVLRKILSHELCVYDTELTEFINRKIQVIKMQNPVPIFTDEEIIHIYATLQTTNITDPYIREEHVLAIKTKTKQEDKCEICGEYVSQKVKNFCLSNKKFNGKIYCFEHQK